MQHRIDTLISTGSCMQKWNVTMLSLNMWVLSGVEWFLVFVEAILEFRKVWIQFLIKGGVGSNSTNQQLNLGWKHFGNWKEHGYKTQLMEVQEVTPPIITQLMARDILRIVKGWGVDLNYLGAESEPTSQKPNYC